MFSKGNYQGIEYAAALIVGRGHVINTIRKTSAPFLARIQIKGDIVLLEPQQNAADLTSRQKTERKYGQKIRNKDVI
jgi:hypothetical protein